MDDAGEVTVLKEAPLLVDLKMVSVLPTNTKVLFPNPTPLIFLTVPEVTLSQVDPLSVDLTMLPESPTNKNTPEPEEEESSEEETAEETVKGVIVREPLKLVSDLLVVIVLETVIVQSAYIPTLRELKVMVLLPEIAEVVLEEHEPP